MSQQGGRSTGHEDDWWGQLYDDSTEDTGPAAVADSLDDRFESASGAVEDGTGPKDAGVSAPRAEPADGRSAPPHGLRPPSPGPATSARTPGEPPPTAPPPTAPPGPPLLAPDERPDPPRYPSRYAPRYPSAAVPGDVSVPSADDRGTDAQRRPDLPSPPSPPSLPSTSSRPPRPAVPLAEGPQLPPADRDSRSDVPPADRDSGPDMPSAGAPRPSVAASDETTALRAAPGPGSNGHPGSPPYPPLPPAPARPGDAAHTPPPLPPTVSGPPPAPPLPVPPAQGAPTDAPRAAPSYPPPLAPPPSTPFTPPPTAPADAPAHPFARRPLRPSGTDRGPGRPEYPPPPSPPPSPFGLSDRPSQPTTSQAQPGVGAPYFTAPPATDYVGSGPPTYDAEPTALPPADPDALDELVADTVLDGARYGACTIRAVSVRGDSARFRGEPRRDSLLTARFGVGDRALVLVAMASGARATPGAHRAAAEACRWIGRAVGRSHARLAEDILAARRGDLKSGLHRLTDRSLGRLRASAAEQGVDPEEYAASLRCLLLPAHPECRTRVFFGMGAGGLFRLRDGEWQDLEPSVADGAGEAVVGFGSMESETPRGDRLTMDLGIPTPPSPYVPAPEPPREPFRFRASVARPGDTLLLCTGGLAEPLRGEPDLPAHLSERWSGGVPPGLTTFLADTQVRVKGYADDRTAAAVWEA